MDFDFCSPLIDIITLWLERDNIILGLDGPCGSGKTSLADYLSGIFDCNVFHIDDFYLPFVKRSREDMATPGGNIDYERFVSQVMEPLSGGQNVIYNKYDCHKDVFSEPIEREFKKLNIVEGAYSLNHQLYDYYNLKLFLDITGDKQKDRIVSREGERAKNFFDKWIPLEKGYFARENTRERVDYIYKDKWINTGNHLRPVRGNDMDILLEWSNDPLTRANSFSQNKISLEEHESWFNKKLKDSNCLFFIYESAKEEPLGTIRIDCNENKEAYISYSINPTERGKGYGISILRELEITLKLLGKSYYDSGNYPEWYKRDFEGSKLLGEVLEGNNASRSCFENNGYSSNILGDRLCYYKYL